MKVGTIVQLKVACLENPIGSIGVVFYDYGFGSQAIFENGGYDGFSNVHRMPTIGQPIEEDYFLDQIGFEPDLTGYEFKNVLQVEQDFRKGVFDVVLKRPYAITGRKT